MAERPVTFADELLSLLLLMIVDSFIVSGRSFPWTMFSVHWRYDVDGRTRASILLRNYTVTLKDEILVHEQHLSGKDDLRSLVDDCFLLGFVKPVSYVSHRSATAFALRSFKRRGGMKHVLREEYNCASE